MLYTDQSVTVLADAVKVFGVTLVGVSTTTAVKLLFSLGLVLAVFIVRTAILWLARRVLGGRSETRAASGSAKASSSSWPSSWCWAWCRSG